jgi:hypothetical protein
MLQAAIALAVVFNVLAAIVLIRAKPIAFTLFMFIAQPLFAGALVLLAIAVLTELKGRRVP